MAHTSPLRSAQQTAPPALVQTPPALMQSAAPPVVAQQIANPGQPTAAPLTALAGTAPPMGPPPIGSHLGIAKQKAKKASHGYVPLAAPVTVPVQESVVQEQVEEAPKNQEWNLTSLWNKASKVAESTARVVAGNENVLKMAETVNSNLNKWAETLAPKIEIQHEKGYLFYLNFLDISQIKLLFGFVSKQSLQFLEIF